MALKESLVIVCQFNSKQANDHCYRGKSSKLSTKCNTVNRTHLVETGAQLVNSVESNSTTCRCTDSGNSVPYTLLTGDCDCNRSLSVLLSLFCVCVSTNSPQAQYRLNLLATSDTKISISLTPQYSLVNSSHAPAHSTYADKCVLYTTTFHTSRRISLR